MQTKKELDVMRMELLYYIYHNIEYSENPNVKYTPYSSTMTTAPGATLEDITLTQQEKLGEVTLDGDVIATIKKRSVRSFIVTSFTFGSRCDLLIRHIAAKVLDVEIVRFGSIWLGYPTGSPIALPIEITTSNFIPKALLKKAEDEYREYAEKMKGVGVPSSTIDNLNMYFNPNTSSTANRVNTANTATTGFAYTVPVSSYYTQNVSIARPTINVPSNAPGNPALSLAQQQGISHREIERMIHQGRMRR